MTPLLLHSLRAMLKHARALDKPTIEAAIAEIERLRAEVAALRDLSWYAKHGPACPMWGATGDEVCDCGLWGRLAAVRAAERREP